MRREEPANRRRDGGLVRHVPATGRSAPKEVGGGSGSDGGDHDSSDGGARTCSGGAGRKSGRDSASLQWHGAAALRDGERDASHSDGGNIGRLNQKNERLEHGRADVLKH